LTWCILYFFFNNAYSQTFLKIIFAGNFFQSSRIHFNPFELVNEMIFQEVELILIFLLNFEKTGIHNKILFFHFFSLPPWGIILIFKERKIIFPSWGYQIKILSTSAIFFRNSTHFFHEESAMSPEEKWLPSILWILIQYSICLAEF